MNVRWWVLITLVFGLLCACAPVPQASGSSEEVAQTNAPAFAIAELPCAEVRERYIGDKLKIFYTSQSIYWRGAVLPKKEGLACLDVFAEWLKSSPQNAWRVSVGGESGTGVDPQALADKRLELLQRYFLRKGIDTAEWEWQSMTRSVVQLRLDEIRDSP